MNTSVLIENDVKPKSVIIDGNLHQKFKVFCLGKSMKIGGVIENLIGLYLNNPKTIQKLIDELKDKQQ
jgi:hypothetical protein